MGQLQILVERPAAMPRADFNAALRLGLGESAHREGVESLAVHLIDEDASRASAGGLANESSFDALVGVGVSGGRAASAEERSAMDAVLEVARDLGTCHAYRVDYRVIVEHPNVVVGERVPGVVMASTVHRAATLNPKAFDDHWKERHAPLAVKHHSGMWDYRQLSVRAVLTEGSPPWEGIVLMGFPTHDAFETGLFDSPEGQQTIMADTERFLALDRGQTAMMGEYWLRSAFG